MEAKRVPRCRASGHPFLDICPGRQIRQVGAPGCDMSAARRLRHRRDVLFTLCLMVVLVFGRVMPALCLDHVSLQLKWKHQFQFAGYYAALEKGFYRDAGLDVEIREGGPDIDAAKGGRTARPISACARPAFCSTAPKAATGRAGRDLSALRCDPSRAAPRRHRTRVRSQGPSPDGHARQRRHRGHAQARGRRLCGPAARHP